MIRRALGLLLLLPLALQAQGPVPLSDGAGIYLSGGNAADSMQEAAALAAAQAIVPRTPNGVGYGNWSKGKVLLLCLGFSNTALECWGSVTLANVKTVSPPTPESFAGQVAVDTEADHARLQVFDGAIKGQAIDSWTSASASNYTLVRTRLQAAGRSEVQVAAVWLKLAHKNPTDTLLDEDSLVRDGGRAIRAIHIRYPNVRLIYLGSRIYGGYATSPLNPEPYAYRGAFAVQRLVQAQATQRATGQVDPDAGDLLSGAPVLLWGPYLWADGSTPRADGLIWDPVDFQSDGTHPSPSGVFKVGRQLLEFFRADRTSRCWFLASHPVCS